VREKEGRGGGRGERGRREGEGGTDFVALNSSFAGPHFFEAPRFAGKGEGGEGGKKRGREKGS